MLTMVHDNLIFVDGTSLFVDRKFHVGMQKYCELLAEPICTINPSSGIAPTTIDLIEVPLNSLAYSVMELPVPAGRPLSSTQKSLLREQIGRSTLIYGHPNALGWHDVARELGTPYIMMMEYDLETRLRILLTQPASLPRTAWRAARCTLDYFTRDRRGAKSAYEVHCNGYPVFAASQAWARKRLLYLDSRLNRDSVISTEDLEKRLAGRGDGPFKLLFSGRYESLKGADDVVKVASACLQRGYDVELHCHGSGSLKGKMEDLARQSPRSERIKILDALPFPDLLAKAKTFDLFVCCHIQNDPSCTYLESLGCGLPIVGYRNRMWEGLLLASDAGLASPMGDVESVADDIGRLLGSKGTLDAMSRKARAFAAAHCFEHEFELRVNALRAALADIRSAGRSAA